MSPFETPELAKAQEPKSSAERFPLAKSNQPTSPLAHLAAEAYPVGIAALAIFGARSPAAREALESKILPEVGKLAETTVQAIRTGEKVLPSTGNSTLPSLSKLAETEEPAVGKLFAAARSQSGFGQETPFADKPWYTGTFDDKNVWSATREYAKLPRSAQEGVNSLYSDMVPLTKPENVNLFVQKMVPAWERFDKMTAAEIEKLEAQQHDVLPMTLADIAARQRSSAMSRVLGDIADSSTEPMPKMTVEAFKPKDGNFTGTAIMYMDAGQGRIGIRQNDLMRMPDSPSTAQQVGRFGHENVHAMQWYQVFKVSANHANLTADQLQINEPFWNKLKEQTRFAPGYNFKQELIKAYAADTTPLTSRDRLRAGVLVTAHATGHSYGPEYKAAAAQIGNSTELLKQLEQGLDASDVVKELAKRDDYFGDTGHISDKLADVIATNGKSTDARQLLGEGLTENIRQLNELRQTAFGTYFTSPHEVEAWLAQMRIEAAARRFETTLRAR